MLEDHRKLFPNLDLETQVDALLQELDDLGVPTHNAGGKPLTLYGRLSHLQWDHYKKMELRRHPAEAFKDIGG
jgi:hypothetical protein